MRRTIVVASHHWLVHGFEDSRKRTRVAVANRSTPTGMDPDPNFFLMMDPNSKICLKQCKSIFV